ncbi:ulp1 protease family, C-terminal catalytic domain-containing protein [Tanacetum coccineum]
MKKRAIGKVYAKQQTNYAHLGRSGYREMDVDLSKVELDEALKAEILNITCDRTRNWIFARITSPNISSNMEELFRKLVDVDKKIAQGLIPKEKGADSLIVVLGPEHGGRTRMVRDGIGFRKGIKGYKQSKKKNQSIKEIEAIVDRKLAQKDAERDEKRDAKRVLDYGSWLAFVHYEYVSLLGAHTCENVETEASNEGRSQKRLKQNSCKGAQIMYVFSPYTGDKKPIAHGMVYLIGDGTIHGGPLIPYYMKENTLTSKDKASQRKGATLELTLATLNLKQQCVQDAYTRWPSRDADHVFEVPGGMIVGQEDTFNVPISTEDIMKLWNLDGLNSGILLCFEYTFYTKEQDDKSTLQNSGVTLIASTTELSTVNREERSKNAKKAYYGVIQEIWELHYNSTVIPLFKCKWVDNEKGVNVDEDGFTTVNLSTNGYKSEPFILARLATQVFYVGDPNDQRLHVVLYSKRNIVGVENVVDEDEYNQFDELPPFSVGITPSNDVLDDTTYLRSDHDEGLEDDNELALVDPPKRQKRGPSKLKDKPKEPFNVEFNDDGFAIGKHQNDWSTYVGGMARLRISILDDDWSQIKQDQKDALWEIIKKKRAIGKVYAKQQTNYAHLGRSGYRGMDVDLSKVELDEALKAKILNITCDRTRNWILARITSPNICTNMEELFRKLVDVDKKMAQGLIPKEKGAYPLIVVLGPEHGENWLKEIRKRIQKEMPKNAETRWFARDAARDATKEAEIEVESENVETEASNEGRSQKRLKQNSCESTTVVHQEQLKDIKEPKSCMLFSRYTEDKKLRARGMVYPIGDGTIHAGPLLPYYMKVSIDSFVPAFGGTKLPVPSKADDTITLLEQSVGSFFQWPRCEISRIVENTPTSKDKASQIKGATLETTLATLNPENTPTSKDKASLSKAATLQPTLATPTLVAKGNKTSLMSDLQNTNIIGDSQQAEASSPLEDVIQAKKELEKNLITLNTLFLGNNHV